MFATHHPFARRHALLAAILIAPLTGCGGGGGVGSTPPPTPTPAPSPAPTGTTTNFNTAEYRNSNAGMSNGAITAWQNGATGQGVKVGVIDTGIDRASPEFSGRISSASAAFGGNANYQDEDGHGTAVTGILAAGRNNSEIMGVAFNATIIALRADTAGSCATTDGCTFSDSDIATALNRATDNGARVVNLSLGGAGGLTPTLQRAVDRATRAGVVLVVSAGNERDKPSPKYDPNNPSPFATNLLAAGNGLVIIANSVDANGQISSFSDLAGSAQNWVLGALGENVRSLDLKNDPTTYYVYSGTSFSAPQVAGAVALLAQAFPNLTSAQIVDLLLRSATDAGAAGTDSTYGRGLLNIAAAFAPQGTTSLAGSGTPISMSGNGALSAPMGDAATAAGLSAVILDSYGRAYDADLGRTIRTDQPSLALAPRLQGTGRSLSAALGPARFALSIAPTPDGGASVTPLMLSGEQARQVRARAGYIASRIGAHADFALGFAYGAGSMAAMVRGESEPAFLIASAPSLSQGFRSRTGDSFALRWRSGSLGITASGETGGALTPGDAAVPWRGAWREHPYAALGLGLDRAMGRLALAASASLLDERDTVLGARFSPAFGAGSARTLFADADMRWRPGNGWGIRAAWRQGWTWAASGGALRNGALLKSSSFAFDAWKERLFDRHDSLALRVSQPLRISSGGLDLTLPGGYDYESGAASYAVRRYNLAPTGRQIDVEAAYARALPIGDLSANVYYRRDSGNIAAWPDDAGGAIRFTTHF